MKLNRTRSIASSRHAGSAWSIVLFATRLLALGTMLCARSAWADVERQSTEDAWWTGPLLAANAGTLAQGHFLIEPYVFDSVPQGHYDLQGRRHDVPHENDFGSQGYALYGVTDSISAGLIPRFAFDARGPDRSSTTSPQVGDLGLQAQYGLTRFQPGSWIPTTSLVLGETLPTGKYDRLGNHPADGFGAGVYSSSVALYSQYLFWLPTGRILRTRLDVIYSIAGSASVRDVSVYGTTAGFRGRVRPGNSAIADAAGEYSVTRNWVLALDVVYEHDSNTRLTGLNLPPGGSGGGGIPFELNSGASRSWSLAPAIEYNFNARVGVIAGAKLTVAGRNTSDVIIPVAAINIVI
jgi:hypothetical protein